MKWKIKKEHKKSFFRQYYFYAVAEENENKFELECSWAQCVYCIFIYKNKNLSEDPLFYASVDLGDTPSKYIHNILRETQNNIEIEAIRLNDSLEDGSLSDSPPTWLK